MLGEDPRGTPSVTVLIATIPGREKLLERALDSVRAQTRQPDDVVVEFDPERTSAAETRNRGLERVTTEYVAILDDDDILLPNHLEALTRAARKNPDVDLFYPIPEIRNMIDPTILRFGGKRVRPWGIDWTEQHRQHLIQKNNFIPVTVMVRTSALRDVGGFPGPDHPDRRIAKRAEDWLCWRRFALTGKKFHHVKEVTWIWQQNTETGHTGGVGLTRSP